MNSHIAKSRNTPTESEPHPPPWPFNLCQMVVRGAMVFAACSGIGLAWGADQANLGQLAMPAYPLKVSGNGRYLVDQKNAPFLIAGESPQALMVSLGIPRTLGRHPRRGGRG